MGIQTMGSQGGGQQPHLQPLARQGSLYSLTLDEVQNHLGGLGKPLGSMNLDELLKNVWSVETTQGTGMDMGNATSSGEFISMSGLQRQGSITLTRSLSKKTVDEVWKDIQQEHKKNSEERRPQKRQATLGEMTLEDFLAKAGVVAEGSEKKTAEGGLQILGGICSTGSAVASDPMVGPQNFPHQAPWMQYPLQSLHQQEHQLQQQNMMGAYMSGRLVPQPLAVGASPLMDITYPEGQMAMSPLMGTLSDTQSPGCKRVAPEDVVEKTVERRQKRMIKNRESAARSRARKQAYTNELENKISRLEEENERLRKQNELDTMLQCAPPPEPKYQLRRTSSSPF